MDTIQKGKLNVQIMIGILILLDVATSIILFITYLHLGEFQLGVNKLIQSVVRLILEIVIYFFLYKGHKWAKWLMVVLLLLGGIISLFAITNIMTMIIGVIYVIVAVRLITSKPVNEFFQYQRNY